MRNIIWLSRQGTCVACGFNTYTSVDGISHVCADASCVEKWQFLEWQQDELEIYDAHLDSDSILEHDYAGV